MTKNGINEIPKSLRTLLRSSDNNFRSYPALGICYVREAHLPVLKFSELANLYINGF